MKMVFSNKQECSYSLHSTCSLSFLQIDLANKRAIIKKMEIEKQMFYGTGHRKVAGNWERLRLARDIKLGQPISGGINEPWQNSDNLASTFHWKTSHRYNITAIYLNLINNLKPTEIYKIFLIASLRDSRSKAIGNWAIEEPSCSYEKLICVEVSKMECSIWFSSLNFRRLVARKCA